MNARKIIALLLGIALFAAGLAGIVAAGGDAKAFDRAYDEYASLGKETQITRQTENGDACTRFCELDPADGSGFRTLSVSAQGKGTLKIYALSADESAALSLLDATGAQVTAAQANRDGAQAETLSPLSFALPAEGEYRLQVTHGALHLFRAELVYDDAALETPAPLCLNAFAEDKLTSGKTVSAFTLRVSGAYLMKLDCDTEYGFKDLSVTGLLLVFGMRFRVAFVFGGVLLAALAVLMMVLDRARGDRFVRPTYKPLKIAFIALSACAALALVLGISAVYAAPRYVRSVAYESKFLRLKTAVDDHAASKSMQKLLGKGVDALKETAEATGEANDEALLALLAEASDALAPLKALDVKSAVEGESKALNANVSVYDAPQNLRAASETLPGLATLLREKAAEGEAMLKAVREAAAAYPATLSREDADAALSAAEKAWKAEKTAENAATWRQAALDYAAAALAGSLTDGEKAAAGLSDCATLAEENVAAFESGARLCEFLLFFHDAGHALMAACVLFLLAALSCFLLSGYALNFWIVASAVILGLLAIFLVYPFSTLITRSFFSKKADGFTFYNYKYFVNSKLYMGALGHSGFVSLATAVVTTLIGVPLAYLMTRYNVWGKKMFYVFIILALMSPPFLGAYSWILLFGRAGFATKLFASIGITTPTIYGRGGIILVFSLHLYPYIYLYTSGAMTSIDSSLEEAGENLGSTPLRRIRTITLPVIIPSILAGCVMVFMSALADFGTPQLIGEGYSVLSTLVYDAYISEIGSNANTASTLSVVIVACALLILAAQKFYVSRRNYVMTAMRPPQEKEVHGFKRFLVTLPIALVTLIGMLPQFVVIVVSFMETSFSGFTGNYNLSNYREIWNNLKAFTWNTYSYSAIAIVFIVLLGMMISYILVRRRGKVGGIIDTLIMFPFVVPGSVLGVCLIVAFNRAPLILTNTAAIMIISYVIRKLPYTVRSGSAFLYQTDPSIEEASINLGVSPMKTFFTVMARLMLPGILSGAILSWITCINELSSSIMLRGASTTTLSIAVYQEVMRMSDGTAAALATVLTLSTIVSLLAFLRVTKGKVSVI